MLQASDSTWGGSGVDQERTEAFRPIAAPPKDIDTIARIQSTLTLPHFTPTDIWTLGTLLRARLLPHRAPALISILLPASPTPRTVFHTVTHPGTVPDNDIWVARKAKTAFRFGVPSWHMHVNFGGDLDTFRRKYGMGSEEAAAYAIHGGAVPVRVEGVEGVVGVVVVSGLTQAEDHGVVVEVIGEFLRGLRE